MNTKSRATIPIHWHRYKNGKGDRPPEKNDNGNLYLICLDKERELVRSRAVQIAMYHPDKDTGIGSERNEAWELIHLGVGLSAIGNHVTCWHDLPPLPEDIDKV
jgi:hypothetical protein